MLDVSALSMKWFSLVGSGAENGLMLRMECVVPRKLQTNETGTV